MAFQTALKYWQDFDVTSLQRQLDEEAAQIAKRQDESDVSIKRLVELSKEFKRSTTEDVRKKVSPLLKAFQSEVDSLTKRGNMGETVFLTLYKKLVEIPDPVSVLELAITQQQRLATVSDLNVENIKLRETLEEYNKEFAHVKNQEATINKLKGQIRELELSAVERATSKADEIESRLIESYSQKERELQSVITEHRVKMEETQSQTALLQSALQSTQSELFELKTKQEDVSSARSAEVEILVTDLERSNQRLLTAEKQLDNYKKLMAQNQNKSSDNRTPDNTIEIELELKAKEREVTCLLEDTNRLQNNLTQIQLTTTKQITLLQQQFDNITINLREAEEKLKNQNDYNEIKKELSIMKSVEFSTVQQQHSSKSIHGQHKPLEVLLLEKNRALVNENTSLKTELSELRDHFASVQTQYKDSLKTIKDQSDLIGQLEADLTRIRPFLPPRSEAEGQAGPDIMAEVIQNIHNDKSTDNNESLLTIVTSQRERFKQKNIQLESDNQQQRQSINLLQREMETMRNDNVKLYEKIKFLQTYQGNKHSSGHDPTISNYSTQYEAKLDPFSTFGVKERQRKYMQLSGPDKATLLLGRFILSNKVARMVAFCYTIILHIIIILVLARLVNTVDSQTIDLYAECSKQLTEHMHVFHQDDSDGYIQLIQNGLGQNNG